MVSSQDVSDSTFAVPKLFIAVSRTGSGNYELTRNQIGGDAMEDLKRIKRHFFIGTGGPQTIK